MRVVVAWPTVDISEANTTATKWKERGYATAVLTETPVERPVDIDHIVTCNRWMGFPVAANQLCQELKTYYDIVVIGGNDLYPDQQYYAQDLGHQFVDHFGGTFGLMHPTGDRYGLIDDAAICPWIGAEYIERMYAGNGPYYAGYYHYFCDGELQDVAVQNNVFWQRPDLIQYHAHWSRNGIPRPQHLMAAKNNHPEDQRTYHTRKSNNFPGSGPS
jgi:hypothetical protein